MDRIIEPVTFKDLVEADLRRAARLVIEIQDEIDPQFWIATPEGDYASRFNCHRPKSNGKIFSNSLRYSWLEAGTGFHDCV